MEDWTYVNQVFVERAWIVIWKRAEQIVLLISTKQKTYMRHLRLKPLACTWHVTAVLYNTSVRLYKLHRLQSETSPVCAPLLASYSVAVWSDVSVQSHHCRTRLETVLLMVGTRSWGMPVFGDGEWTKTLSCEIQDFVGTHVCEQRVMLWLGVVRVL